MTTKNVDVASTRWKKTTLQQKDGFYTINGIKMNDTQTAIAEKFANIDMRKIPDSDNYFASDITSENGKFDITQIPGFNSKGLSDKLPTIFDGITGFPRNNFAIYKWQHVTRDENSWPAGTTNPTVGPNSYKMETTNDYGILVNIHGSLKLVAKFSMRVPE
ncbi:MAG: hypothetical protein NC236_02395 [Mycoplasma sp.]|nr:hypothetical protein [Mycoplasma sp.]